MKFLKSYVVSSAPLFISKTTTFIRFEFELKVIKMPYRWMSCVSSLILVIAFLKTTTADSVQCNNAILKCTISIESADFDSAQEQFLLQSYGDDYLATILQVELKSSHLEVVPSKLLRRFPSVKQLFLNNSRINTIETLPNQKYFSENENIRIINLSNNDLVVLSDGLFAKQKQCTNLKISHNQLETIAEKAFDGLEDLVSLNLDNNKLVELPRNLLVPLKSLKELTLFYNQLTVLDVALLNPVRSLSVDYRYNPFREIRKASNPVRVSTLNIGHTRLVDINNLTDFAGLTNLKLSDNQYLSVNANSFAKFPWLKNLFMHNMNLGPRLQQNYSLFESCQALELLELNGNNINTLDLKRFPRLANLEFLSLDDNNLKELNLDLLEKRFPKLSLISISGNNWSCDYLDQMLTGLNKSMNGIKIYIDSKRATKEIGCVVTKTAESVTWFTLTMMLIAALILGALGVFLVTLFFRHRRAERVYRDVFNTHTEEVIENGRRESFSDLMNTRNGNETADASSTLLMQSTYTDPRRGAQDDEDDEDNVNEISLMTQNSARYTALVAENSMYGTATGPRNPLGNQVEVTHRNKSVIQLENLGFEDE